MKKSFFYEIAAITLAMLGAVLLVFTYYPVINPIQYSIDSHREHAPIIQYLLGTPVSLLILSGAWRFNRKTQEFKQAKKCQVESGSCE